MKLRVCVLQRVQEYSACSLWWVISINISEFCAECMAITRHAQACSVQFSFALDMYTIAIYCTMYKHPSRNWRRRRFSLISNDNKNKINSGCCAWIFGLMRSKTNIVNSADRWHLCTKRKTRVVYVWLYIFRMFMCHLLSLSSYCSQKFESCHQT